jgi:hypothetical protein
MVMVITIIITIIMGHQCTWGLSGGDQWEGEGRRKDTEE